MTDDPDYKDDGKGSVLHGFAQGMVLPFRRLCKNCMKNHGEFHAGTDDACYENAHEGETVTKFNPFLRLEEIIKQKTIPRVL